MALAVTDEDKPLLFALSESGSIVKFAADGTLRKLDTMAGVAVTATELVLQ